MWRDVSIQQVSASKKSPYIRNRSHFSSQYDPSIRNNFSSEIKTSLVFRFAIVCSKIVKNSNVALSKENEDSQMLTHTTVLLH